MPWASTSLIAWWCAGSNGVARQGSNLDQAVVLGHAGQLAQDQDHAVAQRVGVGGIGQRGLEAVEHRQQVAEQLLVGETAALRDVALHPLALVLEVGTLEQRPGAQLLQFGLQLLEPVVCLLRGSAPRCWRPAW